MNKKIRRDKTFLKYKKRVKYYASIWNKNVEDIINERRYLVLKSQATLCSCYCCSKYYKYNRNDKRLEDKKLLKEFYYICYE